MSKTIFIVEDDIFLQGLEATKLKKEGYDILSAANGVEALKIIDSKIKIDLVLLDLMLPEIDGFTVLKRIRGDDLLAKVPVIVFSNLSEESDIQKAKTLGISEFMVKSNFNLDELAKKVKGLLG
jgi:DNA-binding response OmpR family regulator